MLSRLAAECVEVQILSRRRQPAAVQLRLSGAAALLATMCADALMRLGNVGEARLWYRTAIHAADDSSNSRLRVLVRTQAAMLPYYFGDPQQTVVLAEAALAVTATPSSSAALAAAGRARALARLGSAEQARQAIVQARQMFDQVGDDDSDTAFRFPMKRMLFYLSGASTWLGDTSEAYRVQDEAVRLYGPSPSVPIGRLPGSRRYMAPEEFVRGAVIDQRTTVYALGRGHAVTPRTRDVHPASASGGPAGARVGSTVEDLHCFRLGSRLRVAH
ncbi:hypothetical protein [Salinispora arenicola]|uniref:hypothetical protein n=1 Tax=Salinispora arenicola TaxID=168697 RepID=UPI001E4C98D1|nr:hypothetical protein [Salinispora arenicola]